MSICPGEKTIYTSLLGNAWSLTLLKEYSVDVDRELISQPVHFQLKSTGTCLLYFCLPKAATEPFFFALIMLTILSFNL